jgi:signal transduction histidine kinase
MRGAAMSLRFDRVRLATLLAGTAQLGGLALAISGAGLGWLAVTIAVAGAAVAAALLLPRGALALRRHRELVVVIVLIGLATVWIVLGLDRLGSFGYPQGACSTGCPELPEFFGPGTGSWPWRIGHAALLPLAALLLATGAALVLIADAARLRLGFAPRGRAPWKQITTQSESPHGIVPRAIAGLGLVALAAVLAIGLANPYVQGRRGLEVLGLLIIVLGAATVIGIPVLIGSQLRLDRDKATTAREQERQRFAAHLHDSVLQTLALVQRQASEPAIVVRLARRQEYALRAWMAGETELVSDTLVAALRDSVAGVEDEYGISIELTTIGDRPLNGSGEAVIAAAREALRNAARHAPGSKVFVFAEISERSAEVFVRDDGPGFAPDHVARERRGIRDAIIGRMASAGGHAEVDSALGQGTEVALRIGQVGNGR